MKTTVFIQRIVCNVVVIYRYFINAKRDADDIIGIPFVIRGIQAVAGLLYGFLDPRIRYT